MQCIVQSHFQDKASDNAANGSSNTNTPVPNKLGRHRRKRVSLDHEIETLAYLFSCLFLLGLSHLIFVYYCIYQCFDCKQISL